MNLSNPIERAPTPIPPINSGPFDSTKTCRNPSERGFKQDVALPVLRPLLEDGPSEVTIIQRPIAQGIEIEDNFAQDRPASTQEFSSTSQCLTHRGRSRIPPPSCSEGVERPEVNIGIRRVSTAPAYVQRRRPPEILTPHFIWFPTRARCAPAERSSQHVQRGQSRPIKSCFARASLSEPPSPGLRGRPGAVSRIPGEMNAIAVDGRQLAARRAFPPMKLWALQRKQRDTSEGAVSSSGRAVSSERFLTKGNAAEAATTRTDVHVYPALPLNCIRGAARRSHSQLNGPKPTIQIVESNNGVYEIVWDDLIIGSGNAAYGPGEESFEVDDRCTPTNASEEITTPLNEQTPHFNLERVSTKLAAWSWMKGDREGRFPRSVLPSPEFYVYPDQSSPHFAVAVDDSEDLFMAAPPNSERATQPSTRHQSHGSTPRRASTPAPTPFRSTSTVPEHTSELTSIVSRADPMVSFAETLEDRVSAISGVEEPTPGTIRRAWSAPRRFSNMAEHELRFKSHRDSVELFRRRRIFSDESANGHALRDSFALPDSYQSDEIAVNGAPDGTKNRVQVHFTCLPPPIDFSPPREAPEE